MKLALSGKIASGKSTVAELVVALSGATRVSLADPIRELVAAAAMDTVARDSVVASVLKRLFAGRPAMGLRALSIYDTAVREFQAEFRSGQKPRGLMQTLGGGFRALDEDVWARDLVHGTGSLRGLVVCDDLRYVNEARILRQDGWKLVRCVISNAARVPRVRALYGDIGDKANHASETALDDWRDWDYCLETGVPLARQATAVLDLITALS